MRDARVTLRPVTAADEQLLRSLFAADRLATFLAAGLGQRETEQLVSIQCRAQSDQYALAFPGADSSVIEVDDQSAGRLLVDRRPHEVRIIDIALLPDFRGCGVGASVLLELLDEAAAEGRRVRLSVLRDNPARRLYERLGFTEISGDMMYAEMEWMTQATRIAANDGRETRRAAP